MMDSRFNIPAPAVVKRRRDMCEEVSCRLIVAVPQGDVEASAEADSLNSQPRKASAYTKASVPQTDTGGWA